MGVNLSDSLNFLFCVAQRLYCSFLCKARLNLDRRAVLTSLVLIQQGVSHVGCIAQSIESLRRNRLGPGSNPAQPRIFSFMLLYLYIMM